MDGNNGQNASLAASCQRDHIVETILLRENSQPECFVQVVMGAGA
jgi:hypothetical protein